MNDKNTVKQCLRFVSGIILLSTPIALTYFILYSLPSCNDNRIIFYLNLVSFILFLYFVYFLSKTNKEKLDLSLVPTLWCFIALGFSMITSDVLENRNKKHQWEINGFVSDKYRSDNHKMTVLKIGNETYRGLKTEFWRDVKVGDHILKLRCSNEFKLNGNRIY